MDEHLDECAEDYISDDILDTLNAEAEYADEYPDIDEPWDSVLERQEMEDHEQVTDISTPSMTTTTGNRHPAHVVGYPPWV